MSSLDINSNPSVPATLTASRKIAKDSNNALNILPNSNGDEQKVLSQALDALASVGKSLVKPYKPVDGPQPLTREVVESKYNQLNDEAIPIYETKELGLKFNMDKGTLETVDGHSLSDIFGDKETIAVRSYYKTWGQPVDKITEYDKNGRPLSVIYRTGPYVKSKNRDDNFYMYKAFIYNYSDSQSLKNRNLNIFVDEGYVENYQNDVSNPGLPVNMTVSTGDPYQCFDPCFEDSYNK